MEISSSLLPRALVGSVHGGSRVRVPARAPACGGGPVLFSDEAHLKYYGEKEEKKRAKLIKGLKKDLSELSSIGFGAELDVDQSKRINNVANQLLEQLNQLKIKEKEMKKEMKKKKKEEKSARMKEKKCDDSSSSSSESDCDEPKILRLTDLKIPQNNSSPIVPVRTDSPTITVPVRTDSPTKIIPVLTNLPTKIVPVRTESPTKIEVCVGGKCKKNGSLELLSEIEKKMGIEGAVVGCKCMGKCKEGPNVRISNFGTGFGTGTGLVEEEKLGFLCVGVGLDDVDTIVGEFFGEDKNDAELESQLIDG